MCGFTFSRYFFHKYLHSHWGTECEYFWNYFLVFRSQVFMLLLASIWEAFVFDNVLLRYVRRDLRAIFSSLVSCPQGPFSFCLRLLSVVVSTSLYGLSGSGVSLRSQYIGLDMSTESATSEWESHREILAVCVWRQKGAICCSHRRRVTDSQDERKVVGNTAK